MVLTHTHTCTHSPGTHGKVVFKVPVSSVAEHIHLVEDVSHLILGDDVCAVLVEELVHRLSGANTDAVGGTLEGAG